MSTVVRARKTYSRKRVYAGTRNQSTANTTNADLIRGAPSVPQKGKSKGGQGSHSADYAAGFEASFNLYKSTDIEQLRAKAKAYDAARKLIVEQERATQKVGRLEKQILGLFKVPVKADDADDDDGGDNFDVARIKG